MKELIVKFLKFFEVGIVSTMADWLMFAVSNKMLHWSYWVALIFSFSIGAIINFTLNKKMTFKNKSKNVLQPVVFFTIAGVMLMVSLGLMSGLINIMHLDSLIARIITTGIVFVLNFILHKSITFGRFE